MRKYFLLPAMPCDFSQVRTIALMVKSMSSSEDPFVNYTKPEDLQAPVNKGLVAAYNGRNFRHRATSRRRGQASSHSDPSPEQRSIVAVGPSRDTSVPHLPCGRTLSPTSLHYPRVGVWTDPFDTLPVEQRAVIPKTIQYCKAGSGGFWRVFLTLSSHGGICSKPLDSRTAVVSFQRDCRAAAVFPFRGRPQEYVLSTDGNITLPRHHGKERAHR